MPSAVAGVQLETLQNLSAELGDPQAALRFLTKYLTLLPVRIERITEGLKHHDLASTTDALLSLKITSAMIGAQTIEAACAYLSDLPEAALLQRGTELLPQLQQTASDLNREAALLQTEAAHAVAASKMIPVSTGSEMPY